MQQYIRRKEQPTTWTENLPRISGLRSMSLTERRTRDLGSSDGRAVRQHCKLGMEGQLFNYYEESFKKGQRMLSAHTSLQRNVNTHTALAVQIKSAKKAVFILV